MILPHIQLADPCLFEEINQQKIICLFSTDDYKPKITFKFPMQVRHLFRNILSLFTYSYKSTCVFIFSDAEHLVSTNFNIKPHRFKKKNQLNIDQSLSRTQMLAKLYSTVYKHIVPVNIKSIISFWKIPKRGVRFKSQ